MTLIGILLLVLVGATCGAIAEAIVGFTRGGFILATVIGFVGAWIGSWAAPQLHLPTLLVIHIEGHTVEVVWAILGSVALLLILSLFRRSSYNRWGRA